MLSASDVTCDVKNIEMAELLLSVPLKKSSDVDIVKPLRNVIESTYSGGEGGSVVQECGEALAELARLRASAIWKVFDKSSLEPIYSYYDQLVSLESKVPPHEVQIPFKWKDAFDRGSIFGGRMSLTISSLAYERVCVLFNIGALQSALAAQQPLDTEEELKLAAKLLQQSAGVFSHLKSTVVSTVQAETTPDLAPDTLAALAQLMLAQAQEVIAYKCIRDEMKESMVAKVCAQCEEWYVDAQRALQRDALKPLWDRDWLPAVAAKQAAFRGLAQLYQSLVCRAAKDVGEEIARLQLAVELLRKGTERLSAGGSAGGGAAVLQEALARATRNLQEARKDNDFIYHARVPDPQQLEPVPRAPVAKPLPPPAPPARFNPEGRDLFGALLPAGVQAALAASAARRGAAVGAEVARLRDATQLLNAALASLNLPACLEAGGDGAGGAGGGLPASIREKAAAVRAAGGLPALRRLADELPDLLQRNRDILNEAERMLREEQEADDALRAKHGARWTRTESAKLTEAFRANAAKYSQIIDNAVRADAIVREKLAQHADQIALLAGEAAALEAHVPAGEGAGSGAGGEQPAQQLRALMAQVEALKAERDALEAQLKDATLDLKEQFLGALAQSGAIDEPALSAAALQRALHPLAQRVADTLQRQERLLADIQEAHGALMAARGGASGRDAALGRLCAAHDAYQDLTANLQEGSKFYNDLTQLLVAFQNKVADYCFARRTEKEELLKDLTQEASRPAPAPAPPAQRPAPAPPAPPAQQPQPGASLPYPAQPTGMPLPFAAGAGAPYPYYAPPPMPPMYNPYATLPYPHHARLPQPPQPYQPYQHPAPGAPYQPPGPAPGPAPGYNPYPPHQ